MFRRWAGWVGGVVLAVALLNFVAFIIHSFAIGNGGVVYQENGRYLMNNHGRIAEITESQASRLRAHERAWQITMAFAVLVVAALAVYQRVGRPRGGAEPDAAPDRRGRQAIRDR
jgi:hypothetical protein